MYLGRTGEPVANCNRFRTPPPSGYWYSTFRPHNAGAPSAILATGTPERRLQGCAARSSVAVWHFTIVPMPTTAVFLPMFASDDCTFGPQRAEHTLLSCDVDTFDDRGFAAAGPGLWNCLPSQVKEADLSYNRFRRSLKTFCLDSGATAPCELF